MKITIRKSIRRFDRLSPRSTQGMTDGGRLEGGNRKGRKRCGKVKFGGSSLSHITSHTASYVVNL
jgi:hypothetical protein